MPEQKPLTQKLCPMLHCSVDMHRKLLHSHPIQISLAGSILESFKLFPPPSISIFPTIASRNNGMTLKSRNWKLAVVVLTQTRSFGGTACVIWVQSLNLCLLVFLHTGVWPRVLVPRPQSDPLHVYQKVFSTESLVPGGRLVCVWVGQMSPNTETGEFSQVC